MTRKWRWLEMTNNSAATRWLFVVPASKRRAGRTTAKRARQQVAAHKARKAKGRNRSQTARVTARLLSGARWARGAVTGRFGYGYGAASFMAGLLASRRL